MADNVITLQANTGSQAGPTWTDVTNEVRWSDVSTQDNVASAAWPAMLRPAATQIVSYTYCFTADAVGTGFVGTAGPPVAFDKANYNFAKWHWTNAGTFASAPIFTAYLTNGHAAITRNNPAGGLLQGSADTLNVSNFSYLKGNAWGRVNTAGAPGVAATNAPTVTDGTVGSVSPGAGANWLANFQSLMGDNDYITAPFTPAATTLDDWQVYFALFTGPNMTPSTYTIVITLKYTWT